MRADRGAVAAIVFLLSAAAAAAQDTGAVVRGRVVDGVTGRPVGRARIELGVTNVVPNVTRSVLASPRGEFEVRDLPEGQASIMVEKSGYERGWYPGRRSESVRFQRFTVRKGTSDVVVVTMFRKPAISGHVLDEFGDPVEGAQVRAWRVSRFGGFVTVRGSVLTNDIGEYRLNNLGPGRYVVGALPAWSGKVDRDREALAYGPSFYPGVATLDAAQPIDLPPGQSAADIDLTIAEVPVSSVTGTVIDPDGRPIAWGGVTAYAIAPSLNLERRLAIGGGTVQRDGTFAFRLPPGEYDFEAYAGGSTTAPFWRNYASARASVAGRGVTTIMLTAGPLSTISGRVVLQTSAKMTMPPANLRLTMTAAVDWDDQCRAATEIAILPDGTFRHADVSGSCVIKVDPGAWTLKSVTAGTTDMTDQVIAMQPGRDLTGVQIVVTDRQTALLPTVTDQGGEATDDYAMLVFPQDARRRGEQSRFVRIYSPDFGGPSARREGLRGLPPGSYYAIALLDVSYEDVRDPAYLESLVSQASAIVLTEGDVQRITLRRVGSR